MTRIIHHPHDKLFRASMSDIRVASDFFKAHLPAKILKKIDLKTLALQKSTFIDEAYQGSEADLIYSVNIGHSIGYLYILCEHQSEIDKDMAFRLLVYIIRAMELHRQKNPGSHLPIVYPLVVYSGEKIWTAPVDIFELFGDEEALAREILFQPYLLLDVARLDDEELRKRLWSGLVEFALKYRDIRDLNAFFDTLLPWLEKIEIQQGENFCRIVLNYTVDGLEIDDENLFVEKVKQHLSGKLRGEAMTLAQRFEQKGIKQGIEKEKMIIATRLLAEGVESVFIAKITDLSLSQIEELKKKLNK